MPAEPNPLSSTSKMIPKNVKKVIRKGRIIVFGTSSKANIPNLICVECCGLFNDKILIADVKFDITLSNLKENNNVSVMIDNKKDYFQIKGTAEYFSSGKWLEKVIKMNEGTGYKPKGAVLITPSEIYNLHNQEKLL